MNQPKPLIHFLREAEHVERDPEGRKGIKQKDLEEYSIDVISCNHRHDNKRNEEDQVEAESHQCLGGACVVNITMCAFEVLGVDHDTEVRSNGPRLEHCSCKLLVGEGETRRDKLGAVQHDVVSPILWHLLLKKEERYQKPNNREG